MGGLRGEYSMIKITKRAVCLVLISLIMFSHVNIETLWANDRQLPVHLIIERVTDDFIFSGQVLFYYREHGRSAPVLKPLCNFPIIIRYTYLPYSQQFYELVEINTITDEYGQFFYRTSTPNITPHSYINAQIRIVANDGISSFVVGDGVLTGNFFDTVTPSRALRHDTPWIEQRLPALSSFDFGDIVAEPSGAFNIVRTIQQGFEFMKSTPNVSPPSKTPIVWTDSVIFDTSGMYNFYAGFVYISANPNAMEAFNKSLVLHEYGHVVMFDMLENNLRDNSSSGLGFVWDSWNKSRFDLDPRLAFNEGWATFFGQSVLNYDRYIRGNLSHAATLFYSIENPLDTNAGGFEFAPVDGTTIGSALFNAAILWDITDGINTNEVNPFIENATWEDRVQRDFSELFNIVAYTLNNADPYMWNSPLNFLLGFAPPIPWRGTHLVPDATMEDFFRNYLNHNISPNSREALYFWKVFNYNGMQFDYIPPQCINFVC